jgi:hypothetical protein
MKLRSISGKGISTRKIGLSSAEEARLKAKLRRQSPSEPWVEVQFRTVENTDSRGRPVARRIHDPSVFPPGGARTAMIRCAACDIHTPPQMIEEGQCLDHADHTGWGPSPSAQAIRGLQYFNLRMSELELPPESPAALRREVRRANRAIREGRKPTMQ